MKALSVGFNKIPVCLKDSVPLPLPLIRVFPFLTKFWTFIFYISQPNFMLISFSYFMLHFTWIAEVGKYLFFSLNPTSKTKIQEDSSWKQLSFVGFQSVLWWWPGKWYREVFASSCASESQYEADSGSIPRLCCRAGRALLIHFHTKWRKVLMVLASSVSGDIPSPPLFLPPTSKANKSSCGVFFSASSWAQTVRHHREFFLVFCLSRNWFI